MRRTVLYRWQWLHICVSYQICYFCTKRYFLKLTHFFRLCRLPCKCTAHSCLSKISASAAMVKIWWNAPPRLALRLMIPVWIWMPYSAACASSFFGILSFFCRNVQIHFLCIDCQRCNRHTFHYFFGQLSVLPAAPLRYPHYLNLQPRESDLSEIHVLHLPDSIFLPLLYALHRIRSIRKQQFFARISSTLMFLAFSKALICLTPPSD